MWNKLEIRNIVKSVKEQKEKKIKNQSTMKWALLQTDYKRSSTGHIFWNDLDFRVNGHSDVLKASDEHQ
jgi:hypothetical protein